jgi:membrane protease subunit HflK
MFNKLFEILIWAANKLPHFVTIPPDEQAVILRFGKYYKTLDEGGHYYFHWPVIHTVMTVATTRQLIDIDKQDIITSDGESIVLNASVEYVIDEPYKALLSVNDYDENLQEFAGNIFREVIMSRTLKQCVNEVDDIILGVTEKIEQVASEQYGICVLQVFVPTFTTSYTIRLIQE